MAQQTTTVEVFVLVDSNGDYGVGTDPEAATEHYTDNIGAIDGTDGFRTIRLNLTLPLPVLIELTGTVPSDDTPATLTVVAP